MTKVRLVIDTIPPRPLGPNVGQPPKFFARWLVSETSIYRSKRCESKDEAERLAKEWLARKNHLRRAAGSTLYEIIS